MPQVFRAGEYNIYTSSGKCLMCNNNSRIPRHTLKNLMRMIESRSDEAISLWIKYFGSVEYYC